MKHAIVVGGGLAGIATSLDLAEAGVRVSLLEARSRLGGRAGSFQAESRSTDGRITSQTLDYCQHVGMGCCQNLKRLIERLDQHDDWEIQRQLHFFGPDGRYRCLRGLPLLPAPLHLATWLLSWPGLRLRDRLSVARGLMAIRRLKLDAQAEQLSALQWLRQQGQTPRAIDHFWQTIVVSALGEQLDRVHLAAVGMVLQVGFLNDRDGFHLLVPKRPLSELFGLRALASLQQSGVEVRLGNVVRQVDCSSSSGIVVETSGEQLMADRLVLALPWHQLAKLNIVGSAALCETAERAAELNSSPISGVHTWWDREWFDLPHAAIVGRMCQWVFPKPNETPGVDGQTLRAAYYQIVISGSRSLQPMSDEELATAIHRDLEHVFPNVRGAQLLRCKAVTDPRAVFSIAPGTSQWRALPPLAGDPRVVLAGDWTDTGWPATMEGAIVSGFRAAQELVQGLS